MKLDWHIWSDGWMYDPPPRGVPIVIKRGDDGPEDLVMKKEDLRPEFNIHQLRWRFAAIVAIDGGKIQ